MTGALRCRFIQILVILTISCVWSSDALQCNWVTQEGKKLNPYIPGDPKSVTIDDPQNDGEALHGCRRKCLEESTFVCAAVNYRHSDRFCELLEENNQTATPSTDSNYQYALRPNCAGIWQPWFAHKGKYIDTEEDQELNVTVTKDLRSCMSRCVQHLGPTNCSFIVISTRTSDMTCELVGTPPNSNNSLQIESSTQWQFFRRPNWYHDNAPGAKDTTVKKREDRGPDFTITYHKNIEADGYLVAWQYYTRTSSNPCPTYAGVWKRLNIGYELMTVTLLREGSPDSVVFYFITGTIKRVTERYVPSAFVRDSQNCSGSLISFANLDGDKIVNADVGPSALIRNHSKIGDTFLPDILLSEPRTLSLRPFIAEYLVVSKPRIRIPQFGSDPTLRLLWDEIIGYKSLKSGQQDITGGGIQLTCSTNISFSDESLIPCVSGVNTTFYPTSALSAFLRLPGYTQPYHVRIQVVRNFNGHKLVDGQYKHLLLCARRPMLEDEDVEVSDSGILKARHNRTHSLKTSSLNDSCIQSVIISDEHGERLAHGPNTNTEFEFEKSEGSHFIISIIANLSSGYQQVVWTGHYETKGAPEAPGDFRVTERLTNSLKIEWDAVSNYPDGNITNYQVDCMVLNPSFYLDVEDHTSMGNHTSLENVTTLETTTLLETTSSLENNTSLENHTSLENLTLYTGTEEVTVLEVNGLLPQVQYKCQVKALLEGGGYGHRASLSLWTKPIYPALEISSTSVETIVYNGYVAITLPNVTMIDNFVRQFGKIWIVVQRGGTIRNEDSSATTKLTIDDIKTYITAILDVEESSNSFTVGDGQMYGGKRNKALGRGEYTIYVGYKAHTEKEVTEFYQLNEKPLTVDVPTTLPPTLPPATEGKAGAAKVSGSISLIVIIVGAAVMFVVVLVVIVVLKGKSVTSQDDPNRKITMLAEPQASTKA